MDAQQQHHNLGMAALAGEATHPRGAETTASRGYDLGVYLEHILTFDEIWEIRTDAPPPPTIKLPHESLQPPAHSTLYNTEVF